MKEGMTFVIGLIMFAGTAGILLTVLAKPQAANTVIMSSGSALAGVTHALEGRA